MKKQIPEDWMETIIYGLLAIVLIGLAICFILLTDIVTPPAMEWLMERGIETFN